MTRRLLIASLLAAFLAGGGLFYLDRHPVHIPFLDGTDPEAPGRDFFRETRAPVLLVTSLVERTRAARARSFARMDWSLGWLNLLEQELGWYSHKDVDALGENPWAGREWVILTAPAARRLPPRKRADLAAWVAQGRALLVVAPPAAWSSFTGVVPGPPTDRVGRLTGVPAVLPPPAAAALAGLPLPFRFYPPERLLPGTEVLLRVDGLPALVRCRRGRGTVFSLLFELGRLLVTVQQGRPSRDNYTLAKRFGAYPFVLEPEDLLWHEAYRRNPVPAADLVERALVRAVRAVVPLPGWWAFPYRAEGLLLMTHDEDEYGSNACRLLLEGARRHRGRATFFLIAGRRMADGWPAEAVRAFHRGGAHLALHWNRLPMITGLWRVEPVSRVFPLRDQVAWFRERLRAGGVTPGPLINRNHYLALAAGAAFRAGQAHYTRTFRILLAHGVVMDSTYGPNRGGRGYLFGTGRPFLPLDVDGTVLPLWEVPFVSQENWGGEDEGWFARLFRESAEGYHTAIACIFHPHLIVKSQAGRRLWESVYRAAARHGHPAWSLAQYHRFLSARRRSAIEPLPGPLGHYRVTVRTPGLALLFAGPAPPAGLRLDGRPVGKGAGRTTSLDGAPVYLLPLKPGVHRVELRCAPE